ncbi:hypothetical protein Y032_0999g3346 [Ancylostoma ceylanicum]|nr:hypothetical protein Y032_0999g3346 [Ancylostoma ceylanicum]
MSMRRDSQGKVLFRSSSSHATTFPLLICCNLQLSICQELECYNDYLYSSDRHLFLDYHNEARLRVASGVEPNGYDEMLPPAANMYKLRWSCVLENEMQERLSKCATEIPPLKGFGQNVMTIYDHKGTLLAPLKEIRETLRDWWGELELNEVSGSTISYTTEDLHNFANMVFADNTEIGCSYASCDDDEFVLIGCLYRKDGAVMNQVLYKNGTRCSTDFDCTTYKNSKCSRDGLCIKGRFTV